MKEYLFSYGTLRKSDVQFEIFGRLLSGSIDTLRGCKLSSIEITDETFLAKGGKSCQLTVVPSDNNGDTVEGIVFDITREELLLVDKYEPAGYTRSKIELESGKHAWVYLAGR